MILLIDRRWHMCAGALELQGLPEAGIEKPTAIYQKRKTLTRNKHSSRQRGWVLTDE
jgi:hypothetical protein